ncbi:hypothetical protein EJB05_28606, partial [Eragrostis curvula]
MAPNTRSCASLSSAVEMRGIAIEDDTEMSRVVDACTDDLEEKEEVYLTKEELNVVELFKLSSGNEMTHEDLVSELFKMSQVEALKLVRNDMSAKLVEHNDMSACLEKENDLLRTTYAECIEKEMQILRDTPCGTCEHLKSQNEVNGVNLMVNGERIGTKRGLGVGRSKGRVRSRVIHTVHMEMTRSTDGFAVWPQNRGGDEDGVLTRVKANGRPVQVKGPDGLGPRRLDGDEVRGTR